MAKELEERKRILAKLKKKEDSIRFGFSDQLKSQLLRCTANLNIQARANRIVEPKQTLYSVLSNREAGYIDIVRNY